MLSFFFEPESVAVIGASANPDKLGHAVLRNLIDCGYIDKGEIYPINPKTSEILGIPAYKSVEDVPGAIDMAVIVIPQPYVPDALRTCGKKGVKGVVIISAGFREAGIEGVGRERELVRIANSMV